MAGSVSHASDDPAFTGDPTFEIKGMNLFLQVKYYTPHVKLHHIPAQQMLMISTEISYSTVRSSQV
eukprot:768590-Hanusia_phi.AAC.14